MKKIISFLKKYQLIIALAIIAGLLAGYKLYLIPQEKEPELEITPTPPPQPTITPVEKSERGISEDEFIQNLLSEYPLTPYLPYPGEKYTIKYTDALTIEVTANQATESASRQEVLEWIEDQGVDPDSHTINWQF